MSNMESKKQDSIETITINGREFVAKDSLPAALPQSKNIVLIRTRSAGVHVGALQKREGTTVELSGATRVWRWKGANTLSELSQKGADMAYTRISELVPSITLTEVIEIIPCSEIAAQNLTTSRWPA